MKTQRGEALIVSLLLAISGCIAAAWLEHLGVPLPTPATHQEKK